MRGTGESGKLHRIIWIIFWSILKWGTWITFHALTFSGQKGFSDESCDMMNIVQKREKKVQHKSDRIAKNGKPYPSRHRRKIAQTTIWGSMSNPTASGNKLKEIPPPTVGDTIRDKWAYTLSCPLSLQSYLRWEDFGKASNEGQRWLRCTYVEARFVGFPNDGNPADNQFEVRTVAELEI